MSWKKFKNKKPHDGDKIAMMTDPDSNVIFVGRISSDTLYLTTGDYIRLSCAKDWWWSYLPGKYIQENIINKPLENVLTTTDLKTIINENFSVNVTIDEECAGTININFMDIKKLYPILPIIHISTIQRAYCAAMIDIITVLRLDEIADEFIDKYPVDRTSLELIKYHINNRIRAYEYQNCVKIKDILFTYIERYLEGEK